MCARRPAHLLCAPCWRGPGRLALQRGHLASALPGAIRRRGPDGEAMCSARCAGATHTSAHSALGASGGDTPRPLGEYLSTPARWPTWYSPRTLVVCFCGPSGATCRAIKLPRADGKLAAYLLQPVLMLKWPQRPMRPQRAKRPSDEPSAFASLCAESVHGERSRPGSGGGGVGHGRMTGFRNHRHSPTGSHRPPMARHLECPTSGPGRPRAPGEGSMNMQGCVRTAQHDEWGR